MCEQSQIDSNLFNSSLSPDDIMSYEIFNPLSTESTQCNFPYELSSEIWNYNTTYPDESRVSRQPQQEMNTFYLSNPTSKKALCNLPRNFEDQIEYNVIMDQELTNLVGQNYESIHFNQANSTYHKDPHLNAQLHDTPNLKMDDYYLVLKDDVENPLDNGSYDSTPTPNNSLWEEISSTSSPEISTQYGKMSLSPVISNSICLSSPTQEFSPRGKEKYSDIIEQSDQLLVNNMNKMDFRLSPTFGSEFKDKKEIHRDSSPILINTSTSDEPSRHLKRSGIDFENARDHPYYYNAILHEDGLYHCPWENKPGSNCQHKPEKLKCNYDKCVDSHLKPYHCKVDTCKGLSFSSTACLLRHEREAHAMHGHGDKPFLCHYEGCERSIPGKGFPRRWNLRDHIRRVHKDPVPSPGQNSESHDSSTDSNTLSATELISLNTRNKRRKRKTKIPAQSNLKMVAASSIMKRPKKSILIENYKQKQLLLLETVKKLEDPNQIDNMALLRSATECIEVMLQTTQKLNLTSGITEKGG